MIVVAEGGSLNHGSCLVDVMILSLFSRSFLEILFSLYICFFFFFHFYVRYFLCIL